MNPSPPSWSDSTCDGDGGALDQRPIMFVDACSAQPKYLLSTTTLHRPITYALNQLQPPHHTFRISQDLGLDLADTVA
jgi:hypothetical protein